MSEISPAHPDEPFHVIIRAPIKRPAGFVDPPQVVWTDIMEQQLWQLLSRQKRQSLDWNLISRQMGVPAPYLIRYATFLYETQLRGLQEQLRLGEAHSRSSSSSRAGSVTGSHDVSMQRTHSESAQTRTTLDPLHQSRPLSTTSLPRDLDSKRFSISSSGTVTQSRTPDSVSPRASTTLRSPSTPRRAPPMTASQLFERPRLTGTSPTPVAASPESIPYEDDTEDSDEHEHKEAFEEAQKDSFEDGFRRLRLETEEAPAFLPVQRPAEGRVSAQNSTGSSFSDISDTSVTESALADAFLSKFNGSKMSIFSKRS